MAGMPVSGPGQYSKRTDKGQPKMPLPNAGYGEQKDFQAIQGGAPMERSAPPAPPQVVGIGEPTQRPDEPVTHGAALGPGGGPESIGMGRSFAQESAVDASHIAEYLPALENMANQPGAPASFVRFVKYVREFRP